MATKQRPALVVKGISHRSMATRRGNCHPADVRYTEAMIEFKRAYFLALMQECNNNITKVAQLAGVNRTSVYKYLKQCSIGVRTAHRGNEHWQQLGS